MTISFESAEKKWRCTTLYNNNVEANIIWFKILALRRALPSSLYDDNKINNSGSCEGGSSYVSDNVHSHFRAEVRRWESIVCSTTDHKLNPVAGFRKKGSGHEVDRYGQKLERQSRSIRDELNRKRSQYQLISKSRNSFQRWGALQESLRAELRCGHGVPAPALVAYNDAITGCTDPTNFCYGTNFFNTIGTASPRLMSYVHPVLESSRSTTRFCCMSPHFLRNHHNVGQIHQNGFSGVKNSEVNDWRATAHKNVYSTDGNHRRNVSIDRWSSPCDENYCRDQAKFYAGLHGFSRHADPAVVFQAHNIPNADIRTVKDLSKRMLQNTSPRCTAVLSENASTLAADVPSITNTDNLHMNYEKRLIKVGSAPQWDEPHNPQENDTPLTQQNQVALVLNDECKELRHVSAYVDSHASASTDDFPGPSHNARSLQGVTEVHEDVPRAFHTATLMQQPDHVSPVFSETITTPQPNTNERDVSCGENNKTCLELAELESQSRTPRIRCIHRMRAAVPGQGCLMRMLSIVVVAVDILDVVLDLMLANELSSQGRSGYAALMVLATIGTTMLMVCSKVVLIYTPWNDGLHLFSATIFFSLVELGVFFLEDATTIFVFAGVDGAFDSRDPSDVANIITSIAGALLAACYMISSTAQKIAGKCREVRAVGTDVNKNCALWCCAGMCPVDDGTDCALCKCCLWGVPITIGLGLAALIGFFCSVAVDVVLGKRSASDDARHGLIVAYVLGITVGCVLAVGVGVYFRDVLVTCRTGTDLQTNMEGIVAWSVVSTDAQGTNGAVINRQPMAV